MGKAIRVTNLFTGKTTTYKDVRAFYNEVENRDKELAGIVGMLSDAYATGRSISTYEWLLGIKVEEADAE